MRIIPIEDADELETTPNGTGPYTLGRYSPGERIVLERYEDYFAIDDEAFVDEIHYIAIPEETARLTALTGDTLHFAYEVSPIAVQTIENIPGIHIEEVETGGHHVLVMIVDQEPFADVRVRQAFKAIVHRPDFITAALQGRGVEANDQPISPLDPMHADLPIPERNVERARELLNEAGYPHGLDITLHTTDGRAGLRDAALTFQELAEPAGIRVEVRNHPNESYWAEIWMVQPFCMSHWNQRQNADLALSVAYVTGAPWNESFWSNERFDEVVLLARETLDEDERRELYREAQELLIEDGGVIIPYFMNVIGAWSTQMRGYRMHPLRVVDLHKVWLEAG